jgi:hypothetical protein
MSRSNGLAYFTKKIINLASPYLQYINNDAIDRQRESWVKNHRDDQFYLSVRRLRPVGFKCQWAAKLNLDVAWVL